MSQEQYPERRRHSRVKARFIVTYKINEPLRVTITINKREIQALMSDLSEGGMAIITEYDIPPLTILLINFTLINTTVSDETKRIKTMDIVGEVRYQAILKNNERRLGIYFSRISKEDRQAIGDFVNATKVNPEEHA